MLRQKTKTRKTIDSGHSRSTHEYFEYHARVIRACMLSIPAPIRRLRHQRYQTLDHRAEHSGRWQTKVLRENPALQYGQIP